MDIDETLRGGERGGPSMIGCPGRLMHQQPAISMRTGGIALLVLILGYYPGWRPSDTNAGDSQVRSTLSSNVFSTRHEFIVSAVGQYFHFLLCLLGKTRTNHIPLCSQKKWASCVPSLRSCYTDVPIEV
jgi:hypothetical protein